MTAVQPEKREDQRVHTALPVFQENAAGITRDVSPSGVFFWIGGTYALGESITFLIELKTPEGGVMLKCQGDVLRTEPCGNDVGVAVRITKIAMEPIKT
ncbi:MAG: PilZ domain-containing protein [Gammaproteobacteria bacterium]|nr:PilZ domain-containing protein [Gammaproteobacteria bacterium]